MFLTRRHFLAASSATLAAAALAPGLHARQAPAATPVFKEIRRNTGIWTARGGTIGWLVNRAGVIAVDSQFPDTARPCLEQLLKASGRTDVVALFNTHHHGDHTGGNGVFRPVTKQIIAHENVPKYLKAAFDRAVAQRATDAKAAAAPMPPAPIDRTFTTVWAFSHGDERVSATYYGPAHTGGDAVIHFERANVAHMGDLMFNRAHPVIDRTNGASIANWIVVLEKVASDLPANTLYIFGHAGPEHDVTGSRADLRHHASYLRALLDYVRGHAKAGRTRDEITASTEILEGFEDYGPLVPRPLGPAYDEVTGQSQ
jgi:cyclase